MIRVKNFHNSILKSCSYCIYDDTSLEGYIVDVGDVEPIISFIKAQSIIVERAFLTHPHFDHVYGITDFVKEYPTVKICCSAETLEGLKDEVINMSYMYLEDDFVIPQGRQFVIINGDSIVKCFDKQIGILQCPGHDSGCLSYVIENNIFTGDSYTPFASVTYNWHRCNKEQALDSEAKIFNLVKTKGLNVYPGHYK